MNAGNGHIGIALAMGLGLGCALGPGSTSCAEASDCPVLTTTAYPTGNNPDRILQGDVDGDGLPDAIVRTATPVTLTLLRGLGLGEFDAPELIASSGGLPSQGDVDGDGDLDIVSLRANPNVLAVLLNDGHGSFLEGNNARLPSGTVNNAVRPLLIDVDGDGDRDIALHARIGAFGSPTLFIYRNDGAGTFTFKEQHLAAVTPTGLEAADLDNDGDLDLVATDSAAGVLLFVNLGDGSFLATGSHMASFGAIGAATLDLDHDGWLDVIVGSISPVLTVYRGKGLSPLGFPSLHDGEVMVVGEPTRMPIAADLDLDGDLDLASLNDANVTILQNDDGAFTAGVPVHVDSDAVGIAVEDVTGDGLPDLLGTTDYLDALVVTRALGDLRFTGLQFGAFPVRCKHLTRGDLDGDGTEELVSVGLQHPAIYIFSMLPDGTHSDPVSHFLPAISSAVCVADLDGDGLDDVVVEGASQIHVYRSLGALTFAPPVSYPAGFVIDWIGAADFDGDGFVDLVLSDQTGDGARFMKGVGGGQFVVSTFIALGNLPGEGAFADYDADGDTDLAIAGAGAGIYMLRNSGSMGFVKTTITGAGAAQGVAFNDIDDDGDLDLLSTSGITDIMGSVKNLGTTWGAATQISLPLSMTDVVPADFDGDGLQDVLLSGYDGVLFLRGHGDGTFDPVSTLARTVSLTSTCPMPQEQGRGPTVAFISVDTPTYGVLMGRDFDTDDDGAPDCFDLCPGFPDDRDGDGDGIPDGCDEPPCFGDLSADGAIDGGDLTLLLQQWGSAGGADLDASGEVDARDLSILLSSWGDCP